MASVGNINLDIYFRVNSIPEPDTAVEAVEAYIGGGGSASNFSVQLVKLGIKVRLIGATGVDEISDALVDDLKDMGVDVGFVKRISTERSGLVTVLIDSNGNRRMIEYRGANLHLSPEDINETSLSGISHLHLATSRLDIVKAGLLKARELGLSTSLDGGAGLASRGLDNVAKVISHVDVWFMNSVEAFRLSGINDPLQAGLRIRNVVDVDELIITLGPRGALLISDDVVEEVEAFKVKPLDTTGAGDAFAAAYIFARIIGLDEVSRLILANAAAAIKVTRRGARSGPDLRELVEFLRKMGYGDVAAAVENSKITTA